MYIRPYIKLNGIDSTMIQGLLVTELPPISKPLERTLVETVDGRDGDVVTKLGFSAYDKPIKIGLTHNYDIDEIIKYFTSEGVVIFSNEPDKYYRYAIYNQIDFERLLRFKTAEVVFHVQPFKYSVEATELEFTISQSPTSVVVRNAGNYYSRPILTITGLGAVTISINGVDLLDIAMGETSQTIRIDCEEMNAYYSNNTLANRIVTGNYDNIMLGLGNNTITATGAVTELKVENYSRWT